MNNPTRAGSGKEGAHGWPGEGSGTARGEKNDGGAREAIPGMSQRAHLSIPVQAQNEKQPAIPAIAARRYQRKELIASMPYPRTVSRDGVFGRHVILVGE